MTVSKSNWIRLLAMPLVLIAAQPSQGAGRWERPAADLAQRIAEFLGPAEAQLTVTDRSIVSAEEVPIIERLLVHELSARGVQLTGIASSSQIHITLSETERQLLWVAEIVQGSESHYAMVPLDPDLVRDPSPPVDREPAMLLTRNLLWRSTSANSPVLAALETPAGLILLEKEAIVVQTKTADGWHEEKRVDLGPRPSQSRDPRGWIVPAPDGFTAYAAGTRCDGNLALETPSQAARWTIQCRESDDPWPVNAGPGTAWPSDATSPAADSGGFKAFFNSGRNFFTGVLTPSPDANLTPFYAIAALPGPRIVLGGIDGKVQALEGGSLKPVNGTRDWGSDFAAIRSRCGSSPQGAQILATGAGEPESDSVRAYELDAQESVPVSAPLDMGGAVTALWTDAGGSSAMAVVRKSPTESEVVRVAAICP